MKIQTPLESGMFSSVGDLPLHPMVVHAAVILLPVAALVLIVAAFVPYVRRRFLGFGVLLALLGMIATFIAKQSGESLAAVVGEPAQHAQWGDILMVVCVVFAAVSVVWWILTRRGDATRGSAQDKNSGATADHQGPGTVATVLGWVTALLSVAVIVLSVLTGHSGAQAVWGGIMGSATSSTTSDDEQAQDGATGASSGASTAPATDGTETSDTAGYTISDVEEHSSSSDCWAAVDGEVYDLTDWVSQHPGGEGAITSLCGTDATSQFERQHGNSSEAQAALEDYLIGSLSE